MTDFLILSPAFIVVFLTILLQNHIQKIEPFSFLRWLIFVVFIDVAHVYATYFKLYQEQKIQKEQQSKQQSKQHKKIIQFMLLGFLLWIVGAAVFFYNDTIFWSILAYFAVFHFIRQQYGLMRFYTKNENNVSGKFSKTWDNILIYTATGYPMIFWFFSNNRQFHWFMEHEFLRLNNPIFLTFATFFYQSIVFIYVIQLVFMMNRHNINVKKNVLITGTFLSWYFGIVYFNNDIIFTVLNVVSHGLPYMAFVYANMKQNKKSISVITPYFFVIILLLCGLFEEVLWENLVWQEHLNLRLDILRNIDISPFHFLLVPFLTLPQLLHYILDGIIWKNSKI